MLRPRTLLLTAAIFLLAHAILWTLVVNLEPSRHPFNVPTMFMYWDSAHYNSLVVRGYFTYVLWAFYPLYPLLLRGFAFLTGLYSRPEIAGLIFSTLLFCAFCLLQARTLNSAGRLHYIRPQTLWGWLFFLFSPGSWVFHSHHTESLFLLLSLGALVASRKGRWKTAALLAGLCALTKNQGAVLAVAVAIDGALQRKGWRDRALIFAGSGLISFLLFACFPIYQYVEVGDALAFVHAQAAWGGVHSFGSYLATVWWGNPWQPGGLHSILHHTFFYLMTISAVGLLIKREFALSFYVFVSLWITPMLGHLENTFRYTSVLFPGLFFLGDHLLSRLPKPLRLALLAGLIFLNLVYARRYALGEWAY
ncbi:MAG: hypothetical protein M3362_06770 [Acidobacteriota bacterium]|nr:hypothetical protein [Acidobacteriota bacterium]